MRSADALSGVVTVYGMAMSGSVGLQMRRILRTRSSSDVSAGYLGIVVVGFGLWLTWGLVRHDVPLIASNIVGLAAGVPTVVVFWRHRPRSRAR